MSANRIVRITLLMLLSGSLHANTYTVTITADNTNTSRNPNTLRWAITQANANAGLDTIRFNIPTSGNTFESDGGNSWAVITLVAALPAITGSVLIDGTSQPNTNTGFMPGKVVGVDGITQGNINYPDVYIVCGYSLPADDAGTAGNGLSVNATDVTIQGLAVSGFGNTNTSQPTGTAHADISILYASAARNINVLVTQCFLSCNPRGSIPSTAARQTKGGGLLVLGNNNHGTVRQNYVAYCGGYGIVFHATQDNASGTSPNVGPSTNWLIEENQVIDIGRSTVFTTASGRAADGISLMTVRNTLVRNNYVQDWEQFGIDLGHNTDDNRVENNTLTGFVKTSGSLPCGAVRTAFSSERDTISKNVIYNNTSTVCLGGIWADESLTSFPGANTKSNGSFRYLFNSIHNNQGSGITLSTNGAGSISGVTISTNEIYENTGLGIDLGYNNLAGPTYVTVNDNGDGDAGPNNMQNFPIIDSASFKAATSELTIWGMAPAASIIEFFTGDGQVNNFVGLGLNYGEGKKYLGTGVEGSSSDGAAGTGSYNIDGNLAVNNVNRFKFSFIVPSIMVNVDDITATATVAGSTSEFGPKKLIYEVLSVALIRFSGHRHNNKVNLNWEAACDEKFRYFSVEYSTNGVDYTALGKVVPNRGWTGAQTFSFTHTNLLSKTNYYRLKMADQDTKTTFSKVLLFKEEQSVFPGVMVYPNLVDDWIKVNIELRTNSRIMLSIYNNDGRLVLSKTVSGKKGMNTFVADQLGYLPRGIYTATVAYDGKLAQEKIMKR
jgi:hypothetical protein